ncbi:hypothetical protein Ari01nite_27200 [Paractinoplanes rishiriensis]|uniref:Uncharacterized protein n=1 Tax=Paractinoplanes rishiriensis TaxID=1050105 RepID=A0A919MX20_9ACTN|nr:hypothetical protein Ari01nite_27200 [Actinoplanes rishiriensis]
MAIYAHPPEQQIDNIASRTSVSAGTFAGKGPGARCTAGRVAQHPAAPGGTRRHPAAPGGTVGVHDRSPHRPLPDCGPGGSPGCRREGLWISPGG